MEGASVAYVPTGRDIEISHAHHYDAFEPL